MPTYKDRENWMFIDNIQCWRNTQGLKRLQTMKSGFEYDINLSGYWVKKKSTAYTLAVILGFTPHDSGNKL